MRTRRLHAALARIGSRTIVSLGMVGVMAWTFVGSLLMGLTTPQNSQPRMVQLWLGGLALIVALGAAAALLAEREG